MTSTAAPDRARTSPSVRRYSALHWVGLIARLVLAGVWFAASVPKLLDLEASVLAVRGYQILPYDVAVVIGYLLPIVELILGVLLLIGLFTRPAAVVTGLIMIAFIAGIAQAWARGLAIDCGCFGGGGELPLEEAQAKYPWDIARDVGLMLLAGLLAWRGRTPFSLDEKLFGSPALDLDIDTDEHDPEPR
ncbi:MAG: MauE/DoxX family redox-associated membrane protein [Propionibacteriaceae bacterium]|nr:MauE/DoxX family redox-associated membrane protein [Propionibacteriaceae bacterium]